LRVTPRQAHRLRATANDCPALFTVPAIGRASNGAASLQKANPDARKGLRSLPKPFKSARALMTGAGFEPCDLRLMSARRELGEVLQPRVFT
jgi:hypothetical protein